jgi:hypothetical protein
MGSIFRKTIRANARKAKKEKRKADSIAWEKAEAEKKLAREEEEKHLTPEQKKAKHRKEAQALLLIAGALGNYPIIKS